MPAVLITIGNFAADGGEALHTYAANVLPLLLGAGGELLFRGGPTDIIVGSNPPDLFFAMRFDSSDTIRRILTSADYLRMVPYRDRAFSQITTVIAKEFPE